MWRESLVTGLLGLLVAIPLRDPVAPAPHPGIVLKINRVHIMPRVAALVKVVP